jgi:hypothetical protein
LGVAPESETVSLSNAAFSLTLLGRHGEALWYVQEALRLRREPGATDAQAVLNAALVASGLMRYRQSAVLAGSALREFSERGLEVQAIDRRLLRRLEAGARAFLGRDSYDVALGEGQAMTVDQAIEPVFSLAE